MCGIAGVVSPIPELRARDVVRSMTGALVHRGPDDEGIATLGEATLGARRLAIIDLSGGHQPMANEDGDVIAVQNGEIYNFLELRGELKARGHRFSTRNDTEILPHAYEEWGLAFVRRLRGMFALAVWDSHHRRLVLARDRFGKKPLFYARAGDSVLFGSEIQALLAHPAVTREIDLSAINDYLASGYIPPPRTAFAQIRKLPPGHTLVLDRGRAEVEAYWRLAFAPKLDLSLDDAASELRHRIEEAVRIRLMSDVPIGAFLSGGLDSSTVVALMARHTPGRVKTFSIGFKDQAYDERGYARVVSETFDTDHHELVVDANDVSVLPMLVRHLGEPFADSSIVPTYQLARITREAVTVALNGDGGDELFAGYDRYKAAVIAELLLRAVPVPARRAVAAAAHALPLALALPRPVARARRFLVALGLDAEDRYARWSGYFTGQLWEQVAGEAIRREERNERPATLAKAAALCGAQHPAELYMAGDILSALPGDLLVKMDIATMANSLEARSPLLDHELAEFVARVPAEYKLSLRTSKVLLRRAMRGILPDQILNRGKMGFTAPVASWLRGPLRDAFGELVVQGRAAEHGLINSRAAQRLHRDHLAGRADHTPLLWNLVMLELWIRECVEAPTPRARQSYALVPPAT